MAYDRRISDWSSDVCSSDLGAASSWLPPLRRQGRAGEGCLSDQRDPWAPPPSLPLPSQGEGPRARGCRRSYRPPRSHQGSVPPRQSRKLPLSSSASPSITASSRSEARRGGKEGVSTCRSRWTPYH